jgi:hypothetical protein
VLLTALNSLFAELVAVSDDDSYYSVLVRRLVARDFRNAAEPNPGLLVVQIDGLSQPVLEQSIRAGRVPVLGGMVRDGVATLHPWVAMLPPTTPASQSGILHGRNDGIAGFRWYEKASGRLLVANHPEDAAEIVRRISDGSGLLARDGASIGNLVTGDAPRSYLTMATIAEGKSRRTTIGACAGFRHDGQLPALAGADGRRGGQGALSGGTPARLVGRAEDAPRLSLRRRTSRHQHRPPDRFHRPGDRGDVLRRADDLRRLHRLRRHRPPLRPEREEAIDALEGIDRAIGSLFKAARTPAGPIGWSCSPTTASAWAPRSVSATAAPRGGHRRAAAGAMSVVGTTDSVESAGMGRRIAAELSRGPGAGQLLARVLPSALKRFGRGAGSASNSNVAPPDVVVASSGNLAHVYFTGRPGRMTDEAIETLYPGLIGSLAGHPGIGVLMVRSASGHALVLGSSGRLDLTSGQLDRIDPLTDYGPRAAENLTHLDGFSNVGDLILLGVVDRVSGEVCGFEELVGSHGGLGGWQTEPFILCPAEFELTDDPPVGAPAVYRQLIAWQAQLRAEHTRPQDVAGNTSTAH